MKLRLTSLLLVVFLTGWLLWPALAGGWSFAFRDAAHFYHPLFEYVREQWRCGCLPLWNPYENLGVPLAAENSSSVFYPGKLLFALPLDYTWLYNVYIVGHVVLAAGTSYALARHLGAGVLGATIGALSYAFGGSVLFQYANVIYLVGAAWLPLAWLLADRALRLEQLGAAFALGAVLGLIVLGGDPQLAYNLAILAAGYAVLLGWQRRKVKDNDEDRGIDKHRGNKAAVTATLQPWYRGAVYLTLSLATAAALSAVQVFPTLEASGHGARSKYDAPRNVYELAHELVAPEETGPGVSLRGLVGVSPSGHQADIYHFSLEPWRAIELVWPNVTGHPFGGYRRWLGPFGLEQNFWTASIYIGLLPLLLGVLGWNVRRAAPIEVQALSWMVVFGAVGSLGAFGLGWLLVNAAGDTQRVEIGGEVGGLYWLLTVLLPGYVQFRYPAKLFVLASLALSMLAARTWDTAWNGNARRPMACLLALPLVSALVAVAAWGVWPLVQERIVETEQAAWLGPFRWETAWTDFVDGLVHTCLVSLSLAAMLWLGTRRPRYRTLFQVAMVVVVAIDLGIAQEPLLEYAPSEDWRFAPAVFNELAAGEDADDARINHEEDEGNAHRRIARVYREKGVMPASFQSRLSTERYREGLIWDRQTLSPKYPLPLRVPMANAKQAVAGFDYQAVLDSAGSYNRHQAAIAIPDEATLDLLGVRWLLVSKMVSQSFSGSREIAEDMFLAQRTTAQERAWIVHEFEVQPRFETRSPRAMRRYLRRMFFPNVRPRDWRHTAVVESDEPVEQKAQHAAPAEAGDDSREHCQIVLAEPNRVEIEAQLASPGLVILADQYYPGWELTVETAGERRRMPILQTNRVMRGVLLTSGRHRLEYRYRPRSVLWGAILSGLSATGLSTCGLILLRRRWADRSHGHL